MMSAWYDYEENVLAGHDLTDKERGEAWRGYCIGYIEGVTRIMEELKQSNPQGFINVINETGEAKCLMGVPPKRPSTNKTVQ